MSDQKSKCDCDRRALLVATTVAGGAAVVAGAVPFVASMTPSERAKAIGAPVEVDIRNLAPGEKMVVKWRGKPVWILRRTPEMIASLSLEAVKGKLKDPDCKDSVQPAYVSSPARAIKDEYFVAIGICTHLGCSPSDKLKPGAAEGMVADWAGGFLCPCHGSIFDLAGRVFEKQPAPTNLEIPPYKYSDDGFFITIGEDSEIKGA